MNSTNSGSQTSAKNNSVTKTLSILSAFTETTPMLRTTDIAAMLGMNISTVSRHLNTLLDCGFLERDDDTGFYYPGLQIVSLAGITLQSNDIYRHAFPELQQLSYANKLYSHMSVPENTEIVHLICCCCKSSNEQLIPMGHRHPMYCSAMGRAMLAYMPSDKVSNILKNSNLDKMTADTKTEISEIEKELEKTKRLGYCSLQNELSNGAASIAAPVFNRKREPVAAISVSTSLWRFNLPGSEDELAKSVMTAANKISGKLGYFPR
ncbi:MAG: IclR family transcriptional regulator [Lachnospiraceae bacterium]|nr:IclR family transcriptional regulator [Lachnospiraceae bacterium]